MTPQQKVEGTSTTSFSDAVQVAASKIDELGGDQEVTFTLARASVTVGGLVGATTYRVELERA